MTAYWDASAFVLLYLQLPGRIAALSSFDRAEANLVSKLTLLESCRAFTSLAARGRVPREDSRRALERLRQDQSRLNARGTDGILHSPILEKYLAVLDRHWQLGTNDTLHLTMALAWKTELKRRITFVTRDTDLARAAKRERLEVLVPSG